MKAIWKEILPITDRQEILLPVGAKILTVQTQYKRLCIWFINENIDVIKTEKHIFYIYVAGHEKEEIEGKYIGTCQLQQGSLVIHIFEKVSNA